MPAKKARISDLLEGKFFSGDKDTMAPSYLITSFGEKISRANLVASVVDKFEGEDGNYSTITIDDGSGAIRVKEFQGAQLKEINVGDLVLVIGKLKEYQNEFYINYEIVRKVDANYEVKHKLEILRHLLDQKKVADEIRSYANNMSEEELNNLARQKFDMGPEVVQVIVQSKKIVDYKPKVLGIIESLDNGEGVDVGKIFEIANLPERIVENTLTEMMNEGLVFEPSIGKLKKV